MSGPIAMVVTLEIKKERIRDFLAVMNEDVAGSLERENCGCLRFDVLRDKSDSKKFILYEAYADEEAAARHRETPHYKLWAEFKASGGVEAQSVIKCNAVFFGSTAPIPGALKTRDSEADMSRL